MSTTGTDRADLTQAPFNLDAESLGWVEKTLVAMTVEQKVGQAMCLYLRADDVPAWTDWLDERGIEPGGVMVVSRSRDKARQDVTALQEWSRTPLLVAGNLESGAVNFVQGSEAFANPMQVAATRQLTHVERLAVHCARIGNDIGVNWAFPPVIDVAVNPRNPITNTRTFGQDPEMVTAMGEAYIRTLEQRAIATSPKHFPGDGVDDRDQHLVTSSNDLSLEEWQRTFAPVYQRAIAAGARTMMVGHIRQPALSRSLVPGIAPEDILSASLAPELVTGVLRNRLGFNGMIVTDNSAMAGMTTVMPAGVPLKNRQKICPFTNKSSTPGQSWQRCDQTCSPNPSAATSGMIHPAALLRSPCQR
ncbi:hypothetical protein DF19_06155 [Streptomyces olindensis]|nr:hypothetical protein DF19_06155 [Streptomyces olindensis]